MKPIIMSQLDNKVAIAVMPNPGPNRKLLTRA